MDPPKKFVIKKGRGWSLCIACEEWHLSNAIFHHEGRHWILCKADYEDYWENTDELLADYKGYL